MQNTFHDDDLKYPDDFLNKIICGDCAEVLKEIPSDTVDALVCDPPYGLTNLNPLDLINDESIKSKGFMGKDWDNLPPIDIWKDCLRVLKHGAFAFVMSIPRQDALMVMHYRLAKAGFNINFSSIYHTFASGFPKSQNISLAIDKKECKNQLTKKLGRKPTTEEFKDAWKTFRKVVGKGYGTSLNYQNKINLEQEFRPKDYYKDKNGEFNITKPTTLQAKSLNGSYTYNPKPAVEIIIVAMKPLSEKTYVDQALKNRKGIVWFDNCKIPYQSDDDKESARFGTQTDIKGNAYGTNRPSEGHILAKNVLSSSKGRFPANLLVSDDILKGNITKSGVSKSFHDSYDGKSNTNFLRGISSPENQHNDSGSFSRYFDIDKWFNERFKNLPEEVQKTFPFLIVPKPSVSEKNKGLEKFDEKQSGTTNFSEKGFGEKDGHKHLPTFRKNFHPTCKSISLMSYLLTLGSRKGDIIIDPFAGSGTTCIAAKMLSRKYIGIEIEPEYVEISKARIKSMVSIDNWL